MFFSLFKSEDKKGNHPTDVMESTDKLTDISPIPSDEDGMNKQNELWVFAALILTYVGGNIAMALFQSFPLNLLHIISAGFMLVSLAFIPKLWAYAVNIVLFFHSSLAFTWLVIPFNFIGLYAFLLKIIIIRVLLDKRVRAYFNVVSKKDE